MSCSDAASPLMPGIERFQHGDVGKEQLTLLHGLFTAVDRRHNFPFGMCALDHAGYAGAHELVIIGNQNSRIHQVRRAGAQPFCRRRYLLLRSLPRNPRDLRFLTVDKADWARPWVPHAAGKSRVIPLRSAGKQNSVEGGRSLYDRVLQRTPSRDRKSERTLRRRPVEPVGAGAEIDPIPASSRMFSSTSWINPTRRSRR